jgi:hypothetical protein
LSVKELGPEQSMTPLKPSLCLSNHGPVEVSEKGRLCEALYFRLLVREEARIHSTGYMAKKQPW